MTNKNEMRTAGLTYNPNYGGGVTKSKFASLILFKRKIRFFWVFALVMALPQIAEAQLPQTLDEMKQDFMFRTAQVLGELKEGNISGAEQQFTAMQTLIGELGEGINDPTAIGMDVGRVGSSFNLKAFEVIGIILMDLQASLIGNGALWQDDPRMYGFISGELAKIGNIASPTVIAGFRDTDEEVQLRSVLVFGVLLGGRADFKSLSLMENNQDLSLLSPASLTQLQRQFVLLKEYDKSSPKLMAISDKVHDMIEAANNPR
jgi:hypothetical protein